MPTESKHLEIADQRTRRRTAIRQLLIFQLKLAIDGAKDIVLAPVSLVLGIIGILSGGSNPQSGLHRVMRWGQRFDDYVGLYRPVENSNPALLDQHIDQAEASLRMQAAKLREKNRDTPPTE